MEKSEEAGGGSSPFAFRLKAIGAVMLAFVGAYIAFDFEQDQSEENAGILQVKAINMLTEATFKDKL